MSFLESRITRRKFIQGAGAGTLKRSKVPIDGDSLCIYTP